MTNESYFSKLLRTEPGLAERCDAITQSLVESAQPDIDACTESDRRGHEALKVYINALPDNY